MGQPDEVQISHSELPLPQDILPSQATLDDIADMRAWPSAAVLTAEDIVVVKGAWNRTLAWKDAMMEAVVYRWIILVPEVYELLSVKFDELPHDLYTMIDKSVRALDPRTEVHHRESYIAGFPACVTRDFGDTPSEIMFHYTLLGLRPRHWALLKESFLFAMKTHNPYMYKEHDGADLDRGDEGAVARFFHIHVVGKANQVLQKHLDRLQSPAALVVRQQAIALKPLQDVGQTFYRKLLTKYPDLIDYFADTDMDHHSQHLHATLTVVGSAGVGLRDILPTLTKLAHAHSQAMIPTSSYAQVGEVLCETLSQAFEMSDEVADFWVYVYMCCATVISAPMAVEERLLSEAREFFEQLAKEEDWGNARLEARLKQVEVEVGLCGTYRHTSAELQAGARLAWRNAPKCIGRIAWDTLLVRDRRHSNTAHDIFEECKEHLSIATGGGAVRSVMTVFAPRKPNQQWGTRFWNSQFCRYAGYRQQDGSVLGDPANVEFTEMVMNRFGWMPPKKRTRFDPLPQIVQLPGEEPVMCEFPRDLFCEIPLSHPKYSKFSSLGLKWTSIPAINNFNMRIGGVDYPCCPFNGWFVDLEISRNLVERYGIGPEVAKICGFDTSNDSTGWRSMVLQAVSCAVTHSFQKKKFSIVDHYTVSTQFLTHVDREKQCGREVPAQWSWIGGFAGVHCPVWHYEMRDFYLRPQYHYMSSRWVVEGVNAGFAASPGTNSRIAPEGCVDNRRVLILFSSTTGTSKRFANMLAKELGYGYRPKVMNLNSFSAGVALAFSHILCCVATFNDGASPMDGSQFLEVLPFGLLDQRTGKPIRFAVMCLGSSVYPKFCAFGKRVDKALQVAGGVRFAKTILSDETRGHAASFQKFLSAVRVELEPKPVPLGTVQPYLEVSLVPWSPPHGDDFLPAVKQGHVQARVICSQELFTKPTAERSTRRISIDISGCRGMSYTTGGHLSVLPVNPHEEILSLCDEIGIPADQLHWQVKAIMVDGDDRSAADISCRDTSLYDALKWHFDITVRASNLADILMMVRNAGGMTAEEHDELMLDDPEDVVARFWWVSRVLRAFPCTRGKITLATLLTTLGAQFPRMYSIASSSLVSPSIVEVCVGLVSIQGNRGLASAYLHSLSAGNPVWISCQSSSFSPPRSLGAPVVMVGAGTGVAPFVGFAQERKHLVAGSASVVLGPAQLFTGCRLQGEQICAALFEEALQVGALGRYSTSFSREPNTERKHVTDALRDAAEEVWEALRHPSCQYYFCGDGRIADSVWDALVECIMRGAGTSRAKAVAELDRMRAEGRYHLDVWGEIAHGNGMRRLQRRQSTMAKRWLKAVQDQHSDDQH